MIAATLMASLFVTACIDGAPHGVPQMMCREFQVRSYPTVEACESGRNAAVDEWLKGVAWLAPHLVGVRCGPAEAEGDDI